MVRLLTLLISFHCAALVQPATAQELSDTLVRQQIDVAWSLTPRTFTKPDGTKITIKKSDKSKVMVPIDVAREVIIAGMLSAQAQACGLKDEQLANFRALMHREEQKKHLTPEQMVFVGTLHLTTVLRQMGDMTIAKKVGRQFLPPGPPPTNCSAEQRDKIKAMVRAAVTE